MADDGSRKSPASAGQPATSEQRTVQTTLSTIGDLGVASRDMFARGNEQRDSHGVLAVIVFFLLVYVLSVAVAGMTLRSSPLVRLLLMPLAPTVCALAAFLISRVWKCRALESKSHLKIWKEALESLAHEAANAANATRANLTGFLDAHPQFKQAEHLEEIEAAVRRIGVAVQDANDPVNRITRKPGDGSSPGLPGGARSRIAL